MILLPVEPAVPAPQRLHGLAVRALGPVLREPQLLEVDVGGVEDGAPRARARALHGAEVGQLLGLDAAAPRRPQLRVHVPAEPRLREPGRGAQVRLDLAPDLVARVVHGHAVRLLAPQVDAADVGEPGGGRRGSSDVGRGPQTSRSQRCLYHDSASRWVCGGGGVVFSELLPLLEPGHCQPGRLALPEPRMCVEVGPAAIPAVLAGPPQETVQRRARHSDGLRERRPADEARIKQPINPPTHYIAAGERLGREVVAADNAV